MTSTSFNVGLTDSQRVSSRVLRPPGGGRTDIFGGDAQPEPTRGRRAGPPPASTNHTVGQGALPAKPTNGVEAPAQNGQAKEAPQTQPQAAPEPAPAAPAEAPKPKVTPEAPKASPAVTPTDKTEPPKRVRVPPGGFSSGLW